MAVILTTNVASGKRGVWACALASAHREEFVMIGNVIEPTAVT